MRAGVLVLLCACGAPAAPLPSSPGVERARSPRRAVIERAPIDPIAVLAPADEQPISWITPDTVQLDLGAERIEGPGDTAPPVEVTIIDRHGSLVRVAVRLEHARFSVWTARDRLFVVLTRDHRIDRAGSAHPAGTTEIVLRAGARVQRLARKAGRTHVRYTGPLELDAWIPDGVLRESTPSRSRPRPVFMRQRLMVTRGAVIHGEPKWGARPLATVAAVYFVESLRDLDGDWHHVRYADGEVSVSGFLSKRAPPGRVRADQRARGIAPLPIVPTAKVASGTCLYSRVDGEPVGYIIGDREVDLGEAGSGWWTLAIDTPWGGVAFAARGPGATELRRCAPPSVP